MQYKAACFAKKLNLREFNLSIKLLHIVQIVHIVSELLWAYKSKNVATSPSPKKSWLDPTVVFSLQVQNKIIHMNY